MVIYKYPLKLVAVQPVAMPEGARILSVANQNGIICLWAEIADPSAVAKARAIEIIGTGNRFPDAYRTFIGTVLDGKYVWHVFERM
jgi:hypothetical protein